MKHLNIFVVTAALFTGCSKPRDSANASASQTPAASAESSQYPTLIIDREHQIRAANTPATYQIRAAPGIRLDTSLFRFTYGTAALVPDMVQIGLDDSHIYRLLRPVVTNMYVIDRITLEPLRDGQFPGFRSGDRAILTIGRTMPDIQHKESVLVSWVGKIEVK